MNKNEITEGLFSAVETIAQSVVNGVSYDKTIVCTIVDDSQRENGEYIVTDGATQFSAYSETTTYRNDNVVYVSLLNGDFSEQKIIIGKKTSDLNEPFNYQKPFDNFLKCTTNIIPIDISNNQENGYGLIANEESHKRTYKKIWTKTDLSKYHKGFTRLGIRADFRSWLRDYDIGKGNYGIELKITHSEDKKANIDSDKYNLEQDNGWSSDRVYFEKNEDKYTQITVAQEDYKPNRYYCDIYELDSYEFMTEHTEPIYYVKVETADNCFEKRKLVKDDAALLEEIVKIQTDESKTEEEKQNKISMLGVYKPNQFYKKTKEKVFSIENGYDKNKKYYIKSNKPLDLKYEDFYTKEEKALENVFAIDKQGNKIEPIFSYPAGTLRDGITYYKQILKDVTKQKEYEPNKYYDKDKNLLTDNGFDPNKTYGTLSYRIAKNEDDRGNCKGDSYFYKYDLDKNEQWKYQQVSNFNNKEQELFVAEYSLINLTKEEYEPGKYYELTVISEIDDNKVTTYTIKEASLSIATGKPEDRKFYEITYESNYKPDEDSILQDGDYYQDLSGKYIKEDYNGFDSNLYYYSSSDSDLIYTPVSITEDQYIANKYYTREEKEKVEKIMYLQVEDMIGNPYSFESNTSQEKLFDISNINDIEKIELSFFQDNNFYNKQEESIEKNNANNLFVSNLELYFGFDISNIEDEFLQLFTYDGMNYQATSNPLENMKTIYLKWAHKEGDSVTIIDKDNVDTFVTEELDKIEDKINNSESLDSDIFEFKLDGSLSPITNRTYYERGIKKKESLNTPVKESSLEFYANIDFYLNESKDYVPGQQYYELGYWEKSLENIIKIKEDTYKRVLTKISANEKYDSSQEYFYEKNYQYTIDVVDGQDIVKKETILVKVENVDENFNFSDGRTYQKYEYQIENAETGTYVYGYKPVVVNETTSKDKLYNYYYDTYTKTNDGNYIITYTPISFEGLTNEENNGSINYEPNTYYYISIEPKDIFDIRWYRYETGAPAADEYSGIYWTKINKPDDNNTYHGQTHIVDNFTCELHPDYIYNKTEQIKAVVLYNDEVYYSEPIIFENNSSVIDLPTRQQENALRVQYMDKSMGNYFLYDESNNLIDRGEASKTRSMQLLFDLNNYSSSSLLKDATKVTWIFPISNTMIKVNTTATQGEYSCDETYGYITDIAARQVYELFYTIDSYYSFSKENNIITCNIEKDGQIYSTTAELTFGQSGSNGTEYTLSLDLLTSDHVVTLNPIGDIYFKDFREVTEEDVIDDSKTYFIVSHENGITYSEQAIGTWDGQTQLYLKDKFIKVESDEIIKFNKSVTDPDKLINSNKLIDPNEICYRQTDDGEYIEIASADVAQEIKVQATLYDQAHQAINIKDCIMTWEWFTPDQKLFDQEIKSDNASKTAALIFNTDDASKPETPMNELCILKGTLHGFGDYDLVSYLPIPIRSDYAPVRFQGPTQIIYSSTGTPNYYKDNICLYYNDSEGNSLAYPIEQYGIIHDETDSYTTGFQIYYIDENDSNYVPSLVFKENSETKEKFCTIQPMSTYVSGVDAFGIQYYHRGKCIWTQPILYIQNRYFSSTINKWDGNLQVDNEKNTILAKMIGAGKKNIDNTFSGVIIGDWTGNVNKNDSTNSMAYLTGIYGFNKGETSFGFMENGTGFIGKADKGRILFDGNNSTITSASWNNGQSRQGLFLDLDDGFLITRNRDGKYIKLNSLANPNNNFTSDYGFVEMGDNPNPGSGKDNDYPFVVYGDSSNYTAIGWNGNLLLHGSPDSVTGEVEKDENNKPIEVQPTNTGFISLNASADNFPINVNNHFGVKWDGSTTISRKRIDNYINKASIIYLEDDSFYTVTDNTKISGTNSEYDRRFDNNNRYDYSQVKSDFHGFHATPEGDLYLSSKLVIGQNFSANKFGYLKAKAALFEDCNANTFDVHYFEPNKTPSKDSKFYDDIRNPEYPPLNKQETPSVQNSNNSGDQDQGTQEQKFKYPPAAHTTIDQNNVQTDHFPLIGQMGVIKGLQSNGQEDEETANLGLVSGKGFGIKLNSKTNMSLEVDNSGGYSNLGGLYLTSDKIEGNATKEIGLYQSGTAEENKIVLDSGNYIYSSAKNQLFGISVGEKQLSTQEWWKNINISQQIEDEATGNKITTYPNQKYYYDTLYYSMSPNGHFFTAADNDGKGTGVRFLPNRITLITGKNNSDSIDGPGFSNISGNQLTLQDGGNGSASFVELHSSNTMNIYTDYTNTGNGDLHLYIQDLTTTNSNNSTDGETTLNTIANAAKNSTVAPKASELLLSATGDSKLHAGAKLIISNSNDVSASAITMDPSLNHYLQIWKNNGQRIDIKTNEIKLQGLSPSELASAGIYLNYEAATVSLKKTGGTVTDNGVNRNEIIFNVTSDAVKFTATAENQTGIYARFA